ncbi:MAG: outer membrane lipoprotein-sorting protein [Ignavibacteriae bacterium]|jgi:outer membrane lipoprotein-sorting protein|nr:outer membrane lipoprotein-sorting protein [Ignavibacteriota bacterium]
MRKFTFSFALLITVSVFAQENNAEKIITGIKNKINKVENYSAEVQVSVKFDFLKMPKSKAEIFFKKPDKFKLKSQKLAILPKGVIDFNPQKILDKDFTSEIIGDTLVDGKKLSVIKIIPNADSIKFASAKLLVDKNEFLIKQIILSLKENAKIITYFNYSDQKEYALPSEIKINLDFSQAEEGENNRRRNIPDNFKGDISIIYSNYKINKGIDDSVFTDENDKNSK